MKCLKLSTDEIGGLWPSFDCRTLSSDFKRTQSYIITLTDQVQHLVDSHDNKIQQLRSRHEHLEKSNNELREKNKEPGSRICDIHQELRSCETSFSDVTILVGRNDCSAHTGPEPVDELLSQYKDMVSDAESKAGHIKIPTIIPHIQDTNMNIDVNDCVHVCVSVCVSITCLSAR